MNIKLTLRQHIMRFIVIVSMLVIMAPYDANATLLIFAYRKIQLQNSISRIERLLKQPNITNSQAQMYVDSLKIYKSELIKLENRGKEATDQSSSKLIEDNNSSTKVDRESNDINKAENYLKRRDLIEAYNYLNAVIDSPNATAEQLVTAADMMVEIMKLLSEEGMKATFAFDLYKAQICQNYYTQSKLKMVLAYLRASQMGSAEANNKLRLANAVFGDNSLENTDYSEPAHQLSGRSRSQVQADIDRQTKLNYSNRQKLSDLQRNNQSQTLWPQYNKMIIEGEQRLTQLQKELIYAK